MGVDSGELAARVFLTFYIHPTGSQWECGNPAFWAGFPSTVETVEKSVLFFWTFPRFPPRVISTANLTGRPGQALVAFDIMPPLQYTRFETYKKDYQEFLDQFQGAIDLEFRDVSIITGDTVAFSRGLERMSGRLKNGQKFDAWVRFTECYRKTNGHWLAIHDHVSVPVDLDSGRAMLNLKP